jgi:hypothetical protein
MAHIFEKLPTELIAMISNSLDMADLSALRRCSKSAHAKFSCAFLHVYMERFGTRTTILDRSGLRHLHAVINFPSLASNIRKLNFLVPFYHSPYEPLWGVETSRHYDPRLIHVSEDNETKAWIQEKLADQASLPGEEIRNMMMEILSSVGALDEITLEVVMYIGVDESAKPDQVNRLNWRSLWALAVQWYRILMSAMARAQVSVSRLVLFQDTKKCSIPTHDFTSPLARRMTAEEEKFCLVGNGVKNFSVSLATTTKPIWALDEATTTSDDSEYLSRFDISRGRRLRHDDPEVDAHADFEGVAALLHQMPHLESLNIHLYNTTTAGGHRSEMRPYTPLVREVFGQPFSNLASLTLQGVPVAAETMIKCLDEHPCLESLSLRYIFLTSGTWAQVFKRFTESPPYLKSAHLSNLMQFGNDQFGWVVVNLVDSPHRRSSTGAGDGDVWGGFERPAPQDGFYEVAPGILLWHTRVIDEEELRRGIDFYRERGFGSGMASGDQHIWSSRRMSDFGPI